MTTETLPKEIITLMNWNIIFDTYKSGKHTMQLLGTNISDNSGFLSDEIIHYNVSTKTVITISGSLYYVTGKPGRPDPEAVKMIAKRIGLRRALILLRFGDEGLLWFWYPIS